MSSFGLSYAPSETLGFIPERLERLTDIMGRQVEEKKAPGVSILIALGTKLSSRFSQVITAIKVTVHKPHAPIAAIFDDVGIVLTRTRQQPSHG